MYIKFNKVVLHHFLSFGDTEIELNNRGFCLVEGINKNPKDAASSNGSGKSSIWSAICWALTGETIQGLHSDLANIQFNDGCYVELYFSVDNHEYKVVRSKDDKKLGTDLKIDIDGEDKSGKGIRESEAILSQYLPDITSQLIGSVIILGQGLPHKFASNSPSGRKEVLEKLSKSDFMIQDLKDRVIKRQDALNNELRKEEDNLLVNQSQISSLTTQQTQIENELKQLEIKPDFDNDLLKNQKDLNDLDAKLTNCNNELEKIDQQTKKDRNELLELTNKKSQILEKNRISHSEATDEYTMKKGKLNTDIYSLSSEIKRLKSITDICPTCGQKIPGILKPDTTEKEKQLATLNEELSSLQNEIREDNSSYQECINKIEEDFKNNTQQLKENITKEEEASNNIAGLISSYNFQRQIINNEIAKITANRDNYNNNKLTTQNKLKSVVEQIKTLNNNRETLENQKILSTSHIDIVSKMLTLIKRDFRGFLLSNIIDYIDKRAKEYCKDIFNTDEINFNLNGNNIDISFCGKAYENLSGGEAQKINIVLILSIRDMMSVCLGFSSNILVLDEITDNLDIEGCDKIINLISTQLKDVGSVFIVSHRADELSIPYDDKIIVEKDEKGVSTLALH